jgi:hypothetical protein
LIQTRNRTRALAMDAKKNKKHWIGEELLSSSRTNVRMQLSTHLFGVGLVQDHSAKDQSRNRVGANTSKIYLRSGMSESVAGALHVGRATNAEEPGLASRAAARAKQRTTTASRSCMAFQPLSD